MMMSENPGPNFTEAVTGLAAVFADASFTADGIAAHLGPDVTEALYRGEPGAVLVATRAGGQLDGLIRTLLVRRPATGEELAELFGPRLALSLIDASFFTITPSGHLEVAFDVRPHVLCGRERLVLSDRDASMTELVPGRDHVLGVGAASL